MVRELYERFLDLERRDGLMHREIGGVRYWHLVRQYVFSRSILPHVAPLDTAHPDFAPGGGTGRRTLASRVLSKLRRWMEAFAAVVFHNPRLAVRRRDVLFALTPRQTDFGDGKKVSVLLDFFVPYLKSSSALLEIVLPPGPTRQPPGRRVFWLRESRRRFDRCSQSEAFVRNAAARRHEAEAIARMLSGEFGFVIAADDILQHIDYAFLTREAYLQTFRTLLRRMSPKVVVTAVQYYTPSFILTEAAHELGIQVVELQHGTVYPEHAAYNLPETGSVYSPDMFLAWGAYWVSQMRNYPNGAALSVGYPYLERCWRLYPPKARAERHPFRVLFVSQGTIGHALAQRAAELRKLLPVEEFAIAYKLHPNESRTWRMRYPLLETSGMEVIEGTARNIYQCLQEADVVVGVSSTALIEGFQWGRRVFVFRDLAGAEVMSGFCDDGLTEFVDTPNELALRLTALARNPPAARLPFDASRFWVENAAENIASFIDAQIAEKSPMQ